MIMLALPYPVSTNRYWRKFRDRLVLSAEAKQYKRTAATAASVAGLKKPMAGDVCLNISLLPKRTKSGAASKTRIDLDNCLKVAIDALNGVAYTDDSQVVRIVADIGSAVEDGGLVISVWKAA